MNAPAPPLEIKPGLPSGGSHAGEWLPLPLAVTLPSTHFESVRVRGFGCYNRAVQMNLDVLPQGVIVRPGETLHATLPIRVTEPQKLGLRDFYVEVEGAGFTSFVPFPDELLLLAPSLQREITVTAEPLYTGEEGTRVEVSLQHDNGTTTFADLQVTFGPDKDLYAGKSRLCLGNFSPGMHEHVELVVTGLEIDIRLVAVAGGQRTNVMLTRTIARVPALKDRSRFCFLEPRRLAADQVTVYIANDPVSLTPWNAAYPLLGGQSYFVEIRPQNPRVIDVQLQDIPNKVSVRKAQHEDNGCWRFEVEVHDEALLSKPDRLVYKSDSPDEKFTGEIPVALCPSLNRRGRFAGVAGAAITLHAIIALFLLVAGTGFSLSNLIAEVRRAPDYSILGLFSIPAILAGLMFCDNLLYRLKS